MFFHFFFSVNYIALRYSRGRGEKVCMAHRPGPNRENRGEDIAELTQDKHKIGQSKVMPI